MILFSGNLYGTTYNGGAFGYGTVFELVKQGNAWAEGVIHSFNADGIDGATPRANLTAVGTNLYGTTSAGGTNYDGTVFQPLPEPVAAGLRASCTASMTPAAALPFLLADCSTTTTAISTAPPRAELMGSAVSTGSLRKTRDVALRTMSSERKVYPFHCCAYKHPPDICRRISITLD